MIHDLTGQHILHQGVKGKIPPFGSGRSADKGIYKNIKIINPLLLPIDIWPIFILK
jgi:hypothetical protein